MKRSVTILLAAALTGFASLAVSAEPKMGFVNTDALMQNSPQFAAAQKTINDEFAPRQEEIKALQSMLTAQQKALDNDGATMTELQRSNKEKDLRDGRRKLQTLNDAAEEDFNVRRDEEMGKLQRILKDEISVYAKANGFDIIFVSGVGYASAAYDVTKPLIEALNKKAGVAAAPAAAAPAAKPPAAPATTTKPPATKPATP